MVIRIPVSAGELFDRLSIVRLKEERIKNSKVIENFRAYRQQLQSVRATLPANANVDSLLDRLYTANSKLWDIENAIRDCERNKDFGDRFVELARQVYLVNDERAELKSEIDREFATLDYSDVKQHPAY